MTGGAVPALFSLLFAVLNGIPDTLCVIGAAALHEAGHLLACLLLHVPIRSFHPAPGGARICYDPCAVSYPAEALIAAAGPAAGLLGAAACIPGVCGRQRALFGMCSLSLSLFNLLPVRGLDGGVLLAALAEWRGGCGAGERALRAASPVCTVLLWMCAAAVQLRTGGNLSLFLVSVYLLTALAL